MNQRRTGFTKRFLVLGKNILCLRWDAHRLDKPICTNLRVRLGIEDHDISRLSRLVMDLSADGVARLQRVKLFLCDVDGVLTDGTVVMGTGSSEWKRFDIRDGFGLRLLQNAGLKVGWVSARPSAATTERAKDLKVDYLHQSPALKVQSIEELLGQAGLGWDDISYIGDDVIDVGALRRAGFSAAPADARPEAKAAAQYVCTAAGGRGAVREVVEMILKTQNRWDSVIAPFA